MQREIERRQKRAMPMARTVGNLYFEYLKFYSGWSKRQELVLPSVQDFRRSPNGDQFITREGNEYTFTTKKSSYVGDARDVELSLHVNGSLVFEGTFAEQRSEHWSSFQATYVSAFIEGPWVAELNQLGGEAARAWSEFGRISQAEKTARQAQRFGITQAPRGRGCVIALLLHILPLVVLH